MQGSPNRGKMSIYAHAKRGCMCCGYNGRNVRWNSRTHDSKNSKDNTLRRKRIGR